MPLSCRSIGGTQVLVFIFNHKIRPTLRGRSWQIVSFRSLYIIRPYQMLSWPEEVGSDVLPYTRKIGVCFTYFVGRKLLFNMGDKTIDYLPFRRTYLLQMMSSSLYRLHHPQCWSSFTSSNLQRSFNALLVR